MREMCFLLLWLGNVLIPSLAIGQKTHDDQFPFMAWDYVDNPLILKSMHDAGITSVAFVPPRMLDAGQQFHLKCIVFDEHLTGILWSKPFDGERFTKNLAALVKQVGNHPALYGYHVKDETD